jgi:hypothetical protein
MQVPQATPRSDTLSWTQAIEAQAQAEMYARWAQESYSEDRPNDAAVQAQVGRLWAQIASNAVAASRT